MNIGENIKRYRKLKKMSQQTLSDLSGVPRVSISRYENGDRTPTIDIVSKIADSLGVNINTLVGNKPTFIQAILKNEFIDKGISLDRISKESNVPLQELQSMYDNTNNYTMGSYFTLLRHYGLSDEDIVKGMTIDAKTNSIYNNTGNDPILNKMKKIFLREPLSTDEILAGVEDLDDDEFVSYLFNLGDIYTSKLDNSDLNEITQDTYDLLMPKTSFNICENIFKSLGYDINFNLDPSLIFIIDTHSTEVVAAIHHNDFIKIAENMIFVNDSIISNTIAQFGKNTFDKTIKDKYQNILNEYIKQRK